MRIRLRQLSVDQFDTSSPAGSGRFHFPVMIAQTAIATKYRAIKAFPITSASHLP
jgi:hypothetical protein